jgi:hypothetical protein
LDSGNRPSLRPAISGRAEKVILGADEEAKKIAECLADKFGARRASIRDVARHEHPSAHSRAALAPPPGLSGRSTRSLEFLAAHARTRDERPRASFHTKNPHLPGAKGLAFI